MQSIDMRRSDEIFGRDIYEGSRFQSRTTSHRQSTQTGKRKSVSTWLDYFALLPNYNALLLQRLDLIGKGKVM